MTDATFSQPTSATQGLQPYRLERGPPKRLYPATIAGFLRLLRQRAAGRRIAPRRSTRNQEHAMALNLAPMIDALQKSVTGIITDAADAEQRDDLIRRSFGEFGTAVSAELAKMAPATDREEPLYKGLGCVGRVAELVRMLSDHAKAIKEGRHPWQVAAPAGDDEKKPKADDPASPDVARFLDSSLHMAELALRAAVNEHVEPTDEDEAPEGFRLVMVPIAEDPDNDAEAIVVKTTLPEELAKLATDPALIGEQCLDLGTGLLLDAGVPVGRLEKMLGVQGLAKAYGVPDDEEGDGPLVGEEGDSPFDIAGRLAAALLIQLDAMRETFEGTQGVDQGVDGEGAGPAPEGAPAGEKKAAPPAGGEEKKEGEEDDEKLGKRAPVAVDPAAIAAQVRAELGLDGIIAELRELAKVQGAQPEAPKAALLAVPREKDLAKAEGLAGGDHGDGYTDEQLAKMDPGRKAEILLKRVHRAGGQTVKM